MNNMKNKAIRKISGEDVQVMRERMDGREIVEEMQEVTEKAAVAVLVETLTAALCMPLDEHEMQVEQSSNTLQLSSKDVLHKHFLAALQCMVIGKEEWLLRILLDLPWTSQCAVLPAIALLTTETISKLASQHTKYQEFFITLVFRILTRFQFGLQRVKSLIAEDSLLKARHLLCKTTSYSLWLHLFEQLLKALTSRQDKNPQALKLLDTAMAEYLAMFRQYSTSILSSQLFTACKVLELLLRYQIFDYNVIIHVKQLLCVASVISDLNKNTRDQLSFRQFLTLPVPGSEFVLVSQSSDSWDSSAVTATTKWKPGSYLLRDVCFWNDKVMSNGAVLQQEGQDDEQEGQRQSLAALTFAEQQLHDTVNSFHQWNEELRKYQYNLKDVVWSNLQKMLTSVAARDALRTRSEHSGGPSRIEIFIKQLFQSLRQFAREYSSQLNKRLRKTENILLQVSLLFQYFLIGSDVFVHHKQIDVCLKDLLLELDSSRQVYRELMMYLVTKDISFAKVLLDDIMSRLQHFAAGEEDHEANTYSSKDMVGLIFELNVFQLLLAHGNALVIHKDDVVRLLHQLVDLIIKLCEQDRAVLPAAQEQYFLTCDLNKSSSNKKEAKKQQAKEKVTLALESYLQKYLLMICCYAVFHRIGDIVDVKEGGDEDAGRVHRNRLLLLCISDLVKNHSKLLFAWLPYQYTLIIYLFLLPLLHRGDDSHSVDTDNCDSTNGSEDTEADDEDDEESTSDDDNIESQKISDSQDCNMVFELKPQIISINIQRVLNTQTSVVQAFAIEGLELLQPTPSLSVRATALKVFHLFFSPWLSTLPSEDFPNIHTFSNKDLIALHEKCLVPYVTKSKHDHERSSNDSSSSSTTKILFANLPTELICHILSYVNYKRIISKIPLISKSFADMLRQPNLMLWEDVYFRSFPKAVFLESQLTSDQRDDVLMKAKQKLKGSSSSAKKRKRNAEDETEKTKEEEYSKLCIICFPFHIAKELEPTNRTAGSLCISRNAIHDYRSLFQRKIERLQDARKKLSKFRLCSLVGCDCVIRGGKKEEDAHFKNHLKAFIKPKKRFDMK